MPLGGIIWGTVMCIPFWFGVIWLVKTGFVAAVAITLAGLVLSGLFVLLILTTFQNTKQDEHDRQW